MSRRAKEWKTMSVATLLVLGAALAVFFAIRLSGSRPRETSQRPPTIVITAPTLGILNIAGGDALSAVEADRRAFGDLFSSVTEATDAPPRCDVLLVYCQIGVDGRLKNTTSSLREVIRDSGAKIVVVASGNQADAYIKAGHKEKYGHANLVMTLDRKGASFETFFSRLFRDMFKGTSMPVAWERLAPQIPGEVHRDAPEAIFACELGHIAFR
jgi:hypothetical protein